MIIANDPSFDLLALRDAFATRRRRHPIETFEEPSAHAAFLAVWRSPKLSRAHATGDYAAIAGYCIDHMKAVGRLARLYARADVRVTVDAKQAKRLRAKASTGLSRRAANGKAAADAIVKLAATVRVEGARLHLDPELVFGPLIGDTSNRYVAIGVEDRIAVFERARLREMRAAVLKRAGKLSRVEVFLADHKAGLFIRWTSKEGSRGGLDLTGEFDAREIITKEAARTVALVLPRHALAASRPRRPRRLRIPDLGVEAATAASVAAYAFREMFPLAFLPTTPANDPIAPAAALVGNIDRTLAARRAWETRRANGWAPKPRERKTSTTATAATLSERALKAWATRREKREAAAR